ncbi:MAG: crossover junction endodeoxyribonuclease RuvC [Actinomycetota bacterium]|nr:crossover junction endodeoxyribonuclease RuvC [Actinomycetota bacterium]
MRIMGIDPGIAVTGYGVIERRNGRLRAVSHGVVRTGAGDSQAVRLAELRAEVAGLIARLRPGAAAIERLFFNANVRTAMAVGQASGVVLASLAEAGVEVTDYTPPQVKLAVAGSGGASKRQVQAMVTSLLGLNAPPSSPDAADALALAIAHHNRSGLARAVAAARDAR